MSIKQQLTEDMKAAMRGGDKHKLGVVRLILAAIKQREVDERIELDDAQVLAVLEKMVKQRRDSIEQYTNGGRPDLAATEQAEIDVIETYLPKQMDENEVKAAVDAAINETGAASAKDMGRVMGALKAKYAGKMDFQKASAAVKAALG